MGWKCSERVPSRNSLIAHRTGRPRPGGARRARGLPCDAHLVRIHPASDEAAPVDLAFTGAPGCYLYHTPDIILGGVTTSTGTSRLAARVPNDRSILCVRVFTQAFPVDSNANSWGRTASNYGRILPGL